MQNSQGGGGNRKVSERAGAFLCFYNFAKLQFSEIQGRRCCDFGLLHGLGFVFGLLAAFCGPADGVCCDPIAVKTRVLCIGVSAAARSAQALTTFVWTMLLQFTGNLV